MRRFTFKGRLLALLVCTLTCINVGAVSLSWDNGTLTLDYSKETNKSLNDYNNDINNNYKGSLQKMIIVGTVSTNDLSTIKNYFDNNKTTQTLDLTEATIDGNISDAQFGAAKLILPPCISSSDVSTAASNSNSQNLCYACSLCDGTLTLVGNNYQNRNGFNVINDDIENKVSPFDEATTINASGYLTDDEKSAIAAVNAASAKTSYEDGVLTLTEADGSSERIASVVEALNASNASKVVFSDGSVWEASTGVLTVAANASDHQAALKAAGFTVSSAVQPVGDYVQVVDGVTIVTNPLDRSDGLETWLTAAEISALGSATSLKLVGNVGDNALAKIGAASTPTTVDLTEAIISEGQASYTYYYLDIDDKTKRNVRYTEEKGTLKNEGGTWYYKDGDNWYAIEDSKVRIYDCEVTGGAKMPDNWKGSLTTLSLPTNSDYNVLGADFCNGFSSLSSVTIPNNITVISNKAFNSNTSLKNVSLPEGLVVIGDYAFYQTGLESVSIPGSVELIDYKAFSECASIAKISFEESDANHHMLVKQESFVFNEECPLRDIYINTSALIDCENWAFDSKVTWGHGDVTRDLCTLHFKADVADHYANLSHPLTTEIAKDAGKFHKWLHQHYNFASNPGANGWWELVNNGTIGDPDDPSMVKGKKFLRTYSDYHYDRIVPAGVKAYIVKGLKKNSDGDYCLDLLQILVIPKRTGVILYGEANSKDENDNPILSMSLCEIANGVPLRRDYWDYLQGEDANMLKNYLWPTCVDMAPDAYKEEGYYYYHLDEDGNLLEKDGYYWIDVKTRNVLREATAPFKVQPYNEQKGFITPDESQYDYAHYNGENLNGFFRNFYMARYSTTNSGKAYKAQNNNKIESDFVSFFRAKKNSTIKPGMAYLHLKADEYKDAQGGEVIINPDTDTERYKDMMSYQVEFKKETGEPVNPAVSGYWVLNLPENGPRPNMDWAREDNWGNRDLVAKKSEEQGGAKFMAVRFLDEPEIIENGDGTATMIVPSSMVEDVNTGVYYNLQGVKVTNPGKGVYIKNGKKVVLN